ncbi:MAG: hypothetical protein RR998_07380 [Oscillospiraceae bacterium]
MAVKFENAVIIPTGDEIRDGTVLDIDSAEIMTQLIKLSPRCRITRIPPERDCEEHLTEIVASHSGADADLIVLIGGSGGGHRYSSTLGKDFTHSALVTLLKPCFTREIYGKNGHLWSKLVCGMCKETLVVNVPGPFTEAAAAIAAFRKSCECNQGLEEINESMARAVFNQYPQNVRANVL